MRWRQAAVPSITTSRHSPRLTNPYAELERLRGEQPVFIQELGSRMEDVAKVFRNADIFSSENVQDPVLPICDEAARVLTAPDYNPIAVMSNRARPHHTRIRKYTLAGFSGHRMRSLEPFIRQRCETMVDTMLTAGSPVEFVAALGHLPGETIFRLIGFPEADDAKLKEWTTNRLAFTWGKASDTEQVDIATKMLSYWRYCVSFVKMRQSEPADDFTSELLAAHAGDADALSHKEIESLCMVSRLPGTRSSPISSAMASSAS